MNPGPLAAALAAVFALVISAGCASTPAGPVAAAGAAAAASGPAAAPRPALPASAASAPAPAVPAPGQPPPFAAVIQGAKAIPGLLPLWLKDEKVWIELRPQDLGKPFFLSPKIAQGIGEPGFYGGTLIGRWERAGRPQIIEFRRVHNVVQLLALNSAVVAHDPRSPAARSVAAGFSPSLLGSSSVASQPHPARQSVLIEAGPLFLADMLGLGPKLQAAYRQGYALDGRHTQFGVVRGTPEQVVFNVNAHYYTAALASAQPGAPAGTPVPSTPGALPDARSLFLGLVYSIARLPEPPMAPRRADARVGYFQSAVDDFGDETGRTPRQRHIHRWRLDKRDPTATLSEPVQPIRFWVDRSVPLRFRDTVQRAILEWNKAFERIGFRDAIVARVQPDDADFDTLDVGIASVRWISSALPSFNGSGPSQVDPRSGEILDADIAIDGQWARFARDLRARVLPAGDAEWAQAMHLAPPRGGTAAGAADATDTCEDGAHAAEQLGQWLDLLDSRAEIDPAGPEAEAFAQAAVFGTVMHEVGHALGLRHNFRASRAYTLAQLADPAFTAEHGIAASVMDYPDINLPPPGVPFARHGSPFRAALGPYDYWAIEFGYKPIAPDQEAAELQRIAARSAEPALAYGTDEDAALGLDAETLQWDLGDDPLAYARGQLAIAADLIARQETRVLKPGEDWSVLRRSVAWALRDAASAAGVAARQIGGLRTLRDHPGSGRDPLRPVPAAVQRQALALIAGLLRGDARLLPSAALQRRLAPDYLARDDTTGQPTDFPVAGAVLQMQRMLLGQLLSDTVTARILDNQAKLAVADRAFGLPELFGGLTQAVWTGLGTAADMPPARRELQREHVNRLGALLLRPASLSRADARSGLRDEALRLRARLQAAAARPGLTPALRAHLRDCADSLGHALQAAPERAGV